MTGSRMADAARSMPRTREMRRRRPVSFIVEGCRLYGMFDLPPGDARALDTGVLMLNSDDGCRLGPHNLWVRLADQLAARGYPCLRFDYRGCGDSEGPEESPPGVVGLADAIAAEWVLRKQTGVRKVVLVGICYGAEVAMLACRCLPAARGLVACSAGRYVTTDTFSNAVGDAAQYACGYLRRFFQPGAWARLLKGGTNVGAILEGLAERLSPARWQHDRNGAEAARCLAGPCRPGLPQLFVYGGADPLTRRCLPGYRNESQSCQLNRRFEVIPEADHNFSSARWSGEVIQLVMRFVSEISADRGEEK